MHPALFYRPGTRLTLPELAAARLDGHVVEVGEGFMPTDTVEGADARATSIADLVPVRAAACAATAAWVHGAGDRAPAVHHVQRISTARFRISLPARVIYHESLLPPEDVQLISAVAVTTPLATARELLLRFALGRSDDLWLRALLQVSPGLAEALARDVDALARRPGSARARRALAQLLDGQDVVTR